MVQHIVMWNLKEDVDKSAAVKKMQEIFHPMPGKVPGLISMEVFAGENGWDACLMSRHEDWEAVNTYQNHPLHKEAQKYVHSVRIERASCDFSL